jgi:chemotaxis methyl-accepting protein methylase
VPALTSEEVYPLAILLSETIERHLTFLNIKNVPSDVNKNTSNIANTRQYPASIITDVLIQSLGKCCFKIDDYD